MEMATGVDFVKKYNISNRMMNKHVRLIGAAIRTFSPPYSEEIFHKQNKAMDKSVKGHWLSLKTKVKECYVTRKDGSKLRLLVCTSKKKSVKKPVTGLLWIHGGGYAIGLPEQDFFFADLFCKDASCIAVLPDYRRSTEAPYPAALEDCYLTLRWMWRNAEKLGINRKQLFVGGDSAGGGLTAAVCLYARDKGKIPVAFHMPLYPMLDDREQTPSSQNNDAPVWNTQANRLGWEVYLNGVEDNVPCYAAPARATDLSGMPPCCTYIGTLEPFHDETIIYCEQLRKEGIPVHIKEFEGCFHAFDIVGYPTKPAKEARAFLRETFQYAQEHYFSE